jgi:DNA-binding TFAR19-related protein (PDSD5 family)
MRATVQADLQTEEQLVAELAGLGVRYLSRQSAEIARSVHAPHELLARLVCQPSSRVRLALIALLLARPDYARQVLRALKSLKQSDAQRLRFYYSAAVILQQQYAENLRAALGANWRQLPDLFADELGLTGDSLATRLARTGAPAGAMERGKPQLGGDI